MRLSRTIFASILFAGMCWGQQPTAPTAADVSAVLGLLDQASQTANLDVVGLRIEKWKTDSNAKGDAQHNAQSLQRSLSASLPQLTGQVRSNPGDVLAMFRLYRTLDATFDVMNSLAESAGAFGPRQEYEALAQDVQKLGQARHDLGDSIERTAQTLQAQLTSYRNAQQLAAQQAAAAPPPKKIIVDNDEKPKKKASAKKKAPASSTQSAPANANATNPQ
jgi:uncharacterized membrane protein YccC